MIQYVFSKLFSDIDIEKLLKA